MTPVSVTAASVLVFPIQCLEVRRQHQGMDRPGVRQVPEGSEEQEKMDKTGCKIICGAPVTLAVKGLMMIMMIFKKETKSDGEKNHP